MFPMSWDIHVIPGQQMAWLCFSLEQQARLAFSGHGVGDPEKQEGPSYFA